MHTKRKSTGEVINVGEQKNTSVYVKNTGNTNVTLYMTTADWLPADIFTYITVSWNAEGQLLMPNIIALCTLTLAVNASTPSSFTTFEFNITISGIF